MIKKILRSIIGAPTEEQKQLYRYNRNLARAVHDIERGKTNSRTEMNTVPAWDKPTLGGSPSAAQRFRNEYEF